MRQDFSECPSHKQRDRQPHEVLHDLRLLHFEQQSLLKSHPLSQALFRMSPLHPHSQEVHSQIFQRPRSYALSFPRFCASKDDSGDASNQDYHYRN